MAAVSTHTSVLVVVRRKTPGHWTWNTFYYLRTGPKMAGLWFRIIKIIEEFEIKC